MWDDFLTNYRQTLDLAVPRLNAIDEAEASKLNYDGGWSAKQIMGHLIDSAANNHQRFVRAQFTDDLVFQGYDQEEWVNVQRYDQSNWGSVVQLWYAHNLHLFRIIQLIPEATWMRPRHPHSLDRIAWQSVPAGESVTLKYFIRDYLGHLQ